MADPGFALQKALYQRLTAELTVPVYDSVPDDTPYPYVTIDAENSTDAIPLTGRRRDRRLIYFSVWSDYPGQAEVKRINGEIVAALDRRPLILEAGTAIEVLVLRTESNREPDLRTYMGSVTAQILTRN